MTRKWGGGACMDEAAALPPLYHPPPLPARNTKDTCCYYKSGTNGHGVVKWTDTASYSACVVCVCCSSHTTPLPISFVCVCMYRRDCTSMLEHRSQKEMFLAIPRWRTQI